MATRFTSGPVHIAYDILGTGDPTVVVVPGWISHLDYDWRVPQCRAMYRRLADGRRLVRYDKRGTGLSDRPPGASDYSLQEQLTDLTAVLDAANVEQAALLAWSQGGPIAIAFAATRPSRVSHLILYSTWAKAQRSPDYPHGRDDGHNAALVDLVRAEWGVGSRAWAAAVIPEGTTEELARFTALQRAATSPQVAPELLVSGLQMDVREMLPRVQAPVLILHRTGDTAVPLSHTTYLIDHLPGAAVRLLPGEHHLPYLGDTAALTNAIEVFLSACVGDQPPTTTREICLSRRELEVLRLIAEGHRNREIAAMLTVSPGTVARHLANIYEKLGVSSRSAATAYGFRHGLV